MVHLKSKSEKFNHIFVDNITREEKDNNTVYKFNIKILTKDVDFNEEQKWERKEKNPE